MTSVSCASVPHLNIQLDGNWACTNLAIDLCSYFIVVMYLQTKSSSILYITVWLLVCSRVRMEVHCV